MENVLKNTLIYPYVGALRKQTDVYPAYVINGVKKSLQQVESGDLMPYKGAREMLGIGNK
ncbi:hypothetical protein [uncultured Mucilaginibacter sp.]|uniref:hypothetical protein n=1 Tax=uncultured Mucilaginibacter sp. TaxID=797541 RepID=UPI0025F34345|nr:hypothetical protein [uncultured Mucilaginibacter sp.]